LHAIPATELHFLARCIRESSHLLDTAEVARLYASLGLTVLPDPFDAQIADRIIDALRAKSPLSVVRIGDGETNLLSFGAYAATPNLDRYAVSELMGTQQDRFEPDETWMLVLREVMLSCVVQADIVGVIGLWQPNSGRVDKLLEVFASDPRGGSGYWRAIDHMLRLARQGVLEGKIVASAHLYFGVLRRLNAILHHAEQVLLLTNRTALQVALAERFPATCFNVLAVGKSQGSAAPPPTSSPDFLVAVERELPRDMRGYCCLIGAGPWAEIYCGWVKQRGGVGIDIGSGFDLLDGEITRPIHRAVGLEQFNAYSLKK